MSQLTIASVLCVLLGASACSFNNRSGAYECSSANTCDDSARVCEDGWCVLPGTASDAAGNPAVDALVCPSECTRCEGNRCIIDCSETDDCEAVVTCPAGIACEVECDGVDSCAGGIDCSQATECILSCGGIDSCAQSVTCGAGACDIACTGIDSCAAGLDCRESCDCRSICQSGCGENLCPGTAACTKDDVCTNEPGACATCSG